MLYKKLFFLFLVLLLFGFNGPINKPYFTKWVITKGSSLKVTGTTNINQFSCVIANYDRFDTLTVFKENAAETIRFTGSLTLDVENFDCHNPAMTRTLRKTLKAKVFPKLIINFISFSRYPNESAEGEDAVEGVVTIQLAGVTKRFNVDYKIIPEGIHSLTMVGTRQVKFSDFNILPPKKLGSLIQSKNELDIAFHLKVKILD